MNKKDIITKMNQELNQVDTNVYERINFEDAMPMNTHDMFTRQDVEAKTKTNWLDRFSYVGLAMAVLTLLLVVGNPFEPTAPSIMTNVLYLDVNPTFAIEIHEDGTLSDINSPSAQGQAIIERLDIELPLTEVVDQLLSELDTEQYLQHNENFIVVTSKKPDEELVSSVDNVINNYRQIQDKNITVLHQELNVDDDLEKQAQDLGISLSKMRFIQRVHEFHGALTIEELAPMSIHDIMEYLLTSDRDITEFDDNLINIQISRPDPTPDPQPEPRPDPDPEPEPSQVTGEQALAIALNHAGVTQSQISDLDIELDDGIWEIDFEVGSTDYQYDIVRRTGVIIEYEIDYDDDDNND